MINSWNKRASWTSISSFEKYWQLLMVEQNQASLVPRPVGVCHDSFIDLFILVMNPGCCVYLLVKNMQCTIWSIFFSLCLFERHCSLPAYCVRIHHAVVINRFNCHTLVKMPSSRKGWRELTHKHKSINAKRRRSTSSQVTEGVHAVFQRGVGGWRGRGESSNRQKYLLTFKSTL